MSVGHELDVPGRRNFLECVRLEREWRHGTLQKSTNRQRSVPITMSRMEFRLSV